MFNYLKKGISTPLGIGIILILSILVLGITYWQYSALQKETELPKIELPKKEDETADWKTYRNEGYGFEVKYPKDWTHHSDVLSIGFSKKFIKDDEFSCVFSISMIPNDPPDHFEDYMSDYYLDEIPESIEKDINGISVLQIQIKQIPYLYDYWIKRKNGEKFSFLINEMTQKFIVNEEGYKVAYGHIEDPECLEIFNQMLSAFRLLEEDEVVDWKTYRNGEYGFEIKHPENYIVKEQTFTYTPLSEELLEELQFTTCMKEFLREKDQFYILNQIKINSPKEIQLDEVNVEVNIYNNPNNLTLNQWLDFWQNLYETHSACYKVETLPIFDRETIVVGGVEGVQGFGGCCGGCVKEIFFSEKNKIYSLSLLGGTPGTLCYEDVCKDCDPCCFSISGVKESIFNQMLSTFRFLE
jgi:hypothetical protein